MHVLKSFDQQLLRLKQALNTTEDQVVARRLGLSKGAFAARKGRDAFPADKLAALAHAHPELGIDVQHVLTGKSGRQRAVEAAASVASESRDDVAVLISSRVRAAEPPTAMQWGSHASLSRSLVELDGDERLHIDQLRHCSPSDREAIYHMARRLASQRPAPPSPTATPVKRPPGPKRH